MAPPPQIKKKGKVEGTIVGSYQSRKKKERDWGEKDS